MSLRATPPKLVGMTTSTSSRVRARALMGFADLVNQCGGEPGALLHELEISPALLEQPDASLEHAQVVRLFERAAERLEVSDFGLQLAQIQDTDALGPVAVIALNAASVGEALDAIHRHMAYISTSAEAVIDPDARPGQAALFYSLNLPIDIPHRQKSELSYAIALRLLRLLAPEQDSSDWEVQFQHEQGLPLDEYRQRLGCRVRFGQKAEGLYFPRALLNQTINTADPVLAGESERYVSHIVRRFPLDLAMQVRTLLEQQLVSGKCTLPRIAQQLMMSPRTLQRRLKQQGSSFDEIADTLRRERAEDLLRNSNKPLESVWGLIGYTEASTFNRACRRWFGQTPLAFRKAFRNTSGASLVS